MEPQNKIIIKGIPVVQNDQEFIIGKVKINELLSFTRYTERVIIGYDEEEKPIYNEHIQRKVERSRVNKIADFLVNDKEATFPTNIVLGVPMNAIAEQKQRDDLIEIEFVDDVAKEIAESKKTGTDTIVHITIIDGQHRVKGIEVAIDRLKNEINQINDPESIEYINKKKRLTDLLEIELVVSYFIDKGLEYQAMIFSTINRTQKRVSQDLVYSLFGLSASDTPYKTALEVVLALNAHENSPFYKRIKLYGGDYRRGDSPPLSQATMIKSIVGLISESLRDSEKDKYKKRKELLKRTNDKYLPFRRYYANNEDFLISDCLFYFFYAVRKVHPGLWKYDGISKPQNILQSTVGFYALLDIMVEILENEKMTDFSKDTFVSFLQKTQDVDFSDTATYPMSTNGKKILYLTLSLIIYPDQANANRKEKERQRLIKETEWQL